MQGFETRARARRGIVGLALVALLAAAAVPAALAAHRSARTLVVRAYVKNASLAFFHADGTPASLQAQPGVGDWLETTERVYRGTHSHHGRRAIGASHTICVFFVADGAPRCDSQLTLNGANGVVLFHTPGGAHPQTVVNGGTGRFAGVTGRISTHDVPNTNDGDIVATLRLRG